MWSCGGQDQPCHDDDDGHIQPPRHWHRQEQEESQAEEGEEEVWNETAAEIIDVLFSFCNRFECSSYNEVINSLNETFDQQLNIKRNNIQWSELIDHFNFTAVFVMFEVQHLHQDCKTEIQVLLK